MAAFLAGLSTAGTLALLFVASQNSDNPFANDVNSGKCSPVTFIWARGTLEAATIGPIVGDPLVAALRQAYSDIAIQGVNYPASVQGNLDYGAAGGGVMSGLITTALQRCPTTKLVIGGYSQGAMVATRAGELHPNDLTAVVLYGNPFHPQGDRIAGVPQSKIISFCAPGDGVCETGTFNITGPHLSYGTNGDVALGVNFIESRVGDISGWTKPATAAPGPLLPGISDLGARSVSVKFSA